MQDPANESYTPIACSFYDELGLRMLRGQPCRLLVAEGGERRTVRARVEDLYTEGAAEYVRLSDGTTVRLDRILRVDDVERPGVC